MRKRIAGLIIICFYLCSFTGLLAQPASQMVKVIVAPDRFDWSYKTGERVKFTTSVFEFGNPVKNVKVQYEIGTEKMPPQICDSTILKTGTITLDGGTMKQPGFLRCTVTAYLDGQACSGYATAGFDPLDIKPTIETPKDFMEFWNHAKAEAVRIPMDAEITLLPAQCTEKVNVYQMNLQNYQIGSRFYGILCIPNKPGKYPALLHVPGAGARPYWGDIKMAENCIITQEIGIHGISVTMESEVYENMKKSCLDGYWFYNLDDRDRYYYKRV